MYNWYSSYCYIREKQNDLLRQAERWRLLRSALPCRKGSSVMRYRLGARLIALGHLLQQGISGV